MFQLQYNVTGDERKLSIRAFDRRDMLTAYEQQEHKCAICGKVFEFDKMHGDHFFIVQDGRRMATPLFVTLLVIETTDVAFAVDSIPAVFSVSRDPFIVLTSNIFAILGLRALYFALAAVAKYFKYLKYGLGFILIFVGVKMLLAMNEYINALGELVGLHLQVPHVEVPTPVSLAVIFGILVLSMLLSVLSTSKKAN